MDILFLHVPKFSNYYKPINQFSFILFPPMGLLGLADYLNKNHRSSQIIHLGVERYKYGKIDLDKIIADHPPAIIGLDLHWHFQAFDVIEVARKIKQAHPDIAVLLGGFTGSFFAEEILRSFGCIDFIIRGDAEVPLLELITHHCSDKDYRRVPNLAFRENSAIRMNPVTFVADQSMLDSISYTDFALMKDYPTFVDSFSRYKNINGVSETFQKFVFGKQKGYPVFIGQGCIHSCSFCGGSKEAQAIINNRTHLCFRSVGSVLSSIKDLQQYGFNFAYLNYDPLPAPQGEEFYFSLFEGIRSLGITLSFEIERWYLPTRRFVQAFRGLPGRDSYITLSVNSHNEEIRRKNRLHRYSNEELEDCLKVMDEEGVNCVLFFASGLPFERAEDLKAMAEYQRQLQKKFRRLKCKTSMIAIEPGSEMSRDPQAYGVEPHRSSFMDYYHYHAQPLRNHSLELGYNRVGCPGEEDVARFFCRLFCRNFKSRRMPSFVGRTLCNIISAAWKTGVFSLFDRVLAATHDRHWN
jgi:radical SAM superfamily enzyme YgiQ (UPF0313 family)